MKRLVGEDINQSMVREDLSADKAGMNHGGGGQFLYEKVLETVSQWGTDENIMFVIGATQADEFVNIRKITPNHFYLVPGVGAQGGSLKEISEKTMIKDSSTTAQCGLLVNASRAIIYASGGEDFAEGARNNAKQYQEEMSFYLE